MYLHIVFPKPGDLLVNRCTFQIHILEFNLFAQSFNHCRSPEGMAHGCYPTQIHGVLAAKRRELHGFRKTLKFRFTTVAMSQCILCPAAQRLHRPDVMMVNLSQYTRLTGKHYNILLLFKLNVTRI